MRSSREITVWGVEILVATTEIDIDALWPMQLGWRDGVADLGTIEAYDRWWVSHRLIPLIDPDQDAPVER